MDKRNQEPLTLSNYIWHAC